MGVCVILFIYINKSQLARRLMDLEKNSIFFILRLQFAIFSACCAHVQHACANKLCTHAYTIYFQAMQALKHICTHPEHEPKFFFNTLSMRLKGLFETTDVYVLQQSVLPPVPEFKDPVFTKTSPKRSFSLNRKRAYWLVFAKTGSIISGTGRICSKATVELLDVSLLQRTVILLDFSVLQHTVLPLNVSVLQQTVLPGCVSLSR